MSNTERQRAWRERQRAKGREAVTIWMTDDERFFVERTLQTMRAEDCTPALCRNKSGQFVYIDV